jgi:hypothetical protein
MSAYQAMPYTKIGQRLTRQNPDGARINGALNGSESGGGLSPAGLFASSRPAIAEITRRGNRKEISMNPLIQLKQTTSIFLASFLLAGFAVLPALQAVSPPPDGGYAGGNTAEGGNALFSLTTGGFNTAVGFLSLSANMTNSFNTAVGAGALLTTTGEGNTATGTGALLSDTTGSTNTADGVFALFSNTTGSDNTAIGRRALQNNTGSSNTAVGWDALFNTSTGDDNVALGRDSGLNQTTGTSNIFIGDIGGAGISNVIAIGNSPVSGTSYNKCYIGAIYGITTGSTTTLPVIIDNFGQLGTAPSAARFKKQIKPMDQASESVLALKPVTFQYKSDKTNTPQFGLVAEEVAAVNPDLVVCDKNGQLYSVRYDAVNAMLLNEFLKEHREVQELKKEVAALTAGLQKVNAQLEASKPTPKVVNDL